MLTAPVLSGSAEAAGEADWREARRARGHPVRGGAEEQTQVSPISLYITSQWSPNPSQVSLVPVTTFCLVSSILLPDPYLEPSSVGHSPRLEVEVLSEVVGGDPHSR